MRKAKKSQIETEVSTQRTDWWFLEAGGGEWENWYKFILKEKEQMGKTVYIVCYICEKILLTIFSHFLFQMNFMRCQVSL